MEVVYYNDSYTFCHFAIIFPLKIHEFAFSFCTIRVIFNMYETNLISLNKVWRRTITPNITQIPEAPLEINYKKKFNIFHSVHREWT